MIGGGLGPHLCLQNRKVVVGNVAEVTLISIFINKLVRLQVLAKESAKRVSTCQTWHREVRVRSSRRILLESKVILLITRLSIKVLATLEIEGILRLVYNLDFL